MLKVLSVLAVASLISITNADEVCDGNGTLWRLSDIHRGLGDTDYRLFESVFRFFGPPTPIETPIVNYNVLNVQSAWHDCFTFWDGTKQFYPRARPSRPATYSLEGNALVEASLICYEHFMYISSNLNTFNVRDGNARVIEPIKQQGRDRELAIEDGVEYGQYPDDVKDCISDNEGDVQATADCIDDAMEDHCWSPLYAASKLAWLAANRASDDGWGWNAKGTKSFDGSECTANCRFFSDVVNYQPQNRYDTLRGKSKFKIKNNGDFRLNLNNRERRWAPLLESDINGFHYEAQHITPHIGFTGLPVGISVADRDAGNKCSEGKFKPAGLPKACAKVDDPKYDYGNEAMAVIDRLNAIVDDDVAMAEVDFFDIKPQVTTAIAKALEKATGKARVLAYWKAMEGVALNDAVLLSWREKVIFDLIRPTTVIQALDDEEITVAVWEDSADRGEIKTIKARDFQAYKRVMPHSEFPSASACICRAVADVSKIFLEETPNLNGPTALEIRREQAPRAGRHNGASLVYPNLNALAEACSESRLNGGMHFSTSVPAAEAMCGDIGRKILDRYKDLVQF